MGTPSTTFLGQDVVEVATPLQHPSAHGMCNNSKSQGKRPGRNGTDPWKGPRQKDDKEFEQMPRVIRNNIPIRLGRNGTDPWKGPRQKDDKEFEQMPRVTRNNIPIRHDDSRWLISGAVCVRSRQ